MVPQANMVFKPAGEANRYDAVQFGDLPICLPSPLIDALPSADPVDAITIGHDDEPMRIHLFMGDGKRRKHFFKIVDKIAELAIDLDRTLGDVLSQSTKWGASPRDVKLDVWLCTVHWWAWKTPASPNHTQPQTMANGRFHPAWRTKTYVAERLSFSYIDRNLFAATATMLELLARFIDSSPDLDWSKDYPPPLAANDESPSSPADLKKQLMYRIANFDHDWKEQLNRQLKRDYNPKKDSDALLAACKAKLGDNQMTLKRMQNARFKFRDSLS